MTDQFQWFRNQMESVRDRHFYAPHTAEVLDEFRDEVMYLIRRLYEFGGVVSDSKGNPIERYEDVAVMVFKDKYSLHAVAFKRGGDEPKPDDAEIQSNLL